MRVLVLKNKTRTGSSRVRIGRIYMQVEFGFGQTRPTTIRNWYHKFISKQFKLHDIIL